MKLIHKRTGLTVSLGTTVVEYSGHRSTVTGWNETRKTVNVVPFGSGLPPLHATSFMADVFGLEFVMEH